VKLLARFVEARRAHVEDAPRGARRLVVPRLRERFDPHRHRAFGERRRTAWIEPHHAAERQRDEDEDPDEPVARRRTSDRRHELDRRLSTSRRAAAERPGRRREPRDGSRRFELPHAGCEGNRLRVATREEGREGGDDEHDRCHRSPSRGHRAPS